MATKYDLLRERRHFALNNQPTSHETNPYPVGQWPVADHSRQRAHYQKWNTQTYASDAWRPCGRYIVPQHAVPRDSRTRYIVAPTKASLGHFPHKEQGHFKHHLSQTVSFDDYRFDRKGRTTKPGRPGQEWLVENAMQRKTEVLPSLRRNGRGLRNPGDKNYRRVENSDRFHNHGATIAHSNFGKISGGHSGELRRVERHAHLGMSTRADDFGRSMQPSFLTQKKINKQPYNELMKEQVKQQEIQAVVDLPDAMDFVIQPENPVMVEEPKSKTSSRKARKK